MPKRRPIDPVVAAVFSDRLDKAMKFHNLEQWPRGQRRREKRVTQGQVAEKVGVGPSLVGLWLKGLRLPRSDDLVRICAFLLVSADWLLGTHTDPAGREPVQPPTAEQTHHPPPPQPPPREHRSEARRTHRRVLSPRGA